MEQLKGIEYSASEIRKILQRLFPHRRLVLSQFTFFNQIGIARPTGRTYRRGRRCYCLQDLLPIACVLALKEEGIPFKNIEVVPTLLQDKAQVIFELGANCRLTGYGERIGLTLPCDGVADPVAEEYLADIEGRPLLFWSFDVGLLSGQLVQVAEQFQQEEMLRAA